MAMLKPIKDINRSVPRELLVQYHGLMGRLQLRCHVLHAQISSLAITFFLTLAGILLHVTTQLGTVCSQST